MHQSSSPGDARYEWELRIAEEAIERYGSTCHCCGEERREFLTVEPIGQGRILRRRERQPLAYWLKRKGWPEGFRTSCWNCKRAAERYGVCPHKEAAI